jgi:membrane-associated protease RseP (regulator of RpoE activity)
VSIKFLACVLILVSSFVIVSAQIPEGQKAEAAKPPAPSVSAGSNKLRDLPFPAGVDLQFIIKSLARDLDINVLFDVESFRTNGRKTFIDLKNVTAAEALDYILLQERLFFEEAGPRTILVASQVRQRAYSPRIGLGGIPMTKQLADHFGVDNIKSDSPASKAELKAGDVIVEIDGVPIKGPLGLLRAIDEKNEGDLMLTIVRDRKRQTISITPIKGIGSVL